MHELYLKTPLLTVRKTVANNKNLKPFPKGVSGNPEGRPKLTPEQRKLQKMSKQIVSRLLVDLGHATEGELLAMIKDPNVPRLEKVFIHCLMHEDPIRSATFILDRVIGKVKDEVEISTPKPTVIKLSESEQLVMGSELRAEDEDELS